MPQVTIPGQNAVDTPYDESGINGHRPSPMINSMPLGEILVALIISQSFSLNSLDNSIPGGGRMVYRN